jgi:cephalosporin hydroxylase
MKNYTAQPGGTLTSNNAGEKVNVDLYSNEGLNMLSNLWIKAAAEHPYMYEPNWFGRPVIQFPTDIVALQELLWKLQPDVVVETGVAHGGSLVLSTSILELIGKGKVIAVDIEIRPHNGTAIEAYPLSHRIELIEGSSIVVETLDLVKRAIGDAKSVLVFLDSNHTEAHVLHELELYGALVTPVSYLVAHDGAQAWVWDIPRGMPEWKDDHPLDAIYKSVTNYPEFTIDQYWTPWELPHLQTAGCASKVKCFNRSME